MPIPDYQTLMLPLLKLAGDETDHGFRDAIERLAEEFDLSDVERSELLPSGTAFLFDNRVGWARTYLKQAGLLESPKRGAFRITPRGIALLKSGVDRVDAKLLGQYSEFKAWQGKGREKSASVAGTSPASIAAQEQELLSDQSPEDRLASAYARLRQQLEIDLLEQVKTASPAFFERLVVDLLVAMGYGGSRQDAGRAIGKAGDGGIDGIIKEDKLGLDAIYLQAKRWEGSVGRPEIQKFAGALQGQRANKGVFITTSYYTKDALEYVSVIANKIILIDGAELVSLMVDHGVGVNTVGVYEMKRVDAEYFEGD